MSAAHGADHGGHGGHGGGGGGSNAMGECIFGHCTEVSAAAGLMTGVCSTIFMGLFDSGGGGGGHDHGHH